MRKISVSAFKHQDLPVGVRFVPDTSDLADEPINNLLSAGNMGGFRILGSPKNARLDLIALYSTFSMEEWPDRLDREHARLTYFGDNRRPGKELHDTTPHGNQALRLAFEWTHLGPDTRVNVPPFFLFTATGEGRSMDFHGIAAPGAPGLSEENDLVARWRTKDGRRFQNYEAIFTILDIPVVPRRWIDACIEGHGTRHPDCPAAWRAWVKDRSYTPRVLE